MRRHPFACVLENNEASETCQEEKATNAPALINVKLVYREFGLLKVAHLCSGAKGRVFQVLLVTILFSFFLIFSLWPVCLL